MKARSTVSLPHRGKAEGMGICDPANALGGLNGERVPGTPAGNLGPPCSCISCGRLQFDPTHDGTEHSGAVTSGRREGMTRFRGMDIESLELLITR